MPERSFVYEILTVDGEKSSLWTGESTRVLLPEQMLCQSRCCSALKPHGSCDLVMFFGRVCYVMLAQSFFCHLGMVNERFSPW